MYLPVSFNNVLVVSISRYHILSVNIFGDDWTIILTAGKSNFIFIRFQYCMTWSSFRFNDMVLACIFLVLIVKHLWVLMGGWFGRLFAFFFLSSTYFLFNIVVLVVKYVIFFLFLVPLYMQDFSSHWFLFCLLFLLLFFSSDWFFIVFQFLNRNIAIRLLLLVFIKYLILGRDPSVIL